MNTIPISRLRECLSLDQATGALTWRISTGRVKPGSTAGTAQPCGRLCVMVDGVQLKAHRIVWALTTGQWPENEIDHIDCDPGNNRPSNLREATHQQNNCNKKKQASNTSGAKGVCFDRQKNKWLARIKVDNKYRHLGYFDDVGSAAIAYGHAASQFHGEFRRVA